ncbi:2-iminobutanoate/2-iminopropanoate deaminase [Micromonospora pallida]|uniref:2-iminobutanoate/2-iminopropanoate deaminase n=1 Tax=Micromonospora pallida TaxID=145854 RepID=A0A1C6SFS6_9ACTN|nr:RidA family protein [Micromonospora pallida]SCL28199.1 2-iminobutanoate/2-iminopropanoate deaminase [Micromonospora pallida]
MTISTYFPNSRRPTGAFSPAVRAGAMVFTSGHVGTDPETGQVAGDDIAAQTRATMESIGRTLEAAGAGFADVVSMTVYLTHGEDLRGMDAVYREFFDGTFPARSTVTVAGLARPDFRVEIDAIAIA